MGGRHSSLAALTVPYLSLSSVILRKVVLSARVSVPSMWVPAILSSHTCRGVFHSNVCCAAMILPLAGAHRDRLAVHNSVRLNEDDVCPPGNFLDVINNIFVSTRRCFRHTDGLAAPRAGDRRHIRIRACRENGDSDQNHQKPHHLVVTKPSQKGQQLLHTAPQAKP